MNVPVPQHFSEVREYSVLDVRTVVEQGRDPGITAEMVGNVLDRQIRNGDVLLRYHNGRFAVILVDVGPEVALVISSRLAAAVEALSATGLSDGEVRVTIDVQSHVHPDPKDDPSVQAAVEHAIAHQVH
ncbi:MAG: diguanylate cyclase [Actinomycetia bacterium]|nr:diguanylate cyclase [Actinomycetes bacterium]